MIPNKLLPGKECLDMLVFPAILILVGVAAFALGRLSVLDGQKPEIKIFKDDGIEYATQP